MNEKQALSILKAALDLGVQKGNFSNLNETLTLVQAYDTLTKFFETEKNEADN